MMNAAPEYPPRVEIIDGKTMLMSPRPMLRHHIVAGNIYCIFAEYLDGKLCAPFFGGVDVHLDDKNWFVPDVMIVCNHDIIKEDGIYGTPDLVVEVLSPSTMKNDRGPKLRAYAKAGVKEYWLVTPLSRTIEVYLKQDGELVLDEVYAEHSVWELDHMDPEDRAAVKMQIKVSLYDDLYVTVADVFQRL